MNCSEARRALLEADPAELAGLGDVRLVQHLGKCPRCRSMADVILSDEKGLAEELISLVPLPDIDSLVDQACGSESRPSRKLFPGFARRTAFALIPMAAAASLAVLFLGGDPPLPGEPYLPPVDPTPEASGLALDVGPGQDVAILATNNPDITVLWFF